MPNRLEKVSCVANRLDKIEFSKVLENFTCDTSVFRKDHDYPDSIQSISNLLCTWDECSIDHGHIFEEEIDIPIPPPPKKKVKSKFFYWGSNDIHDPCSELNQLKRCEDLDEESKNKIQSLLKLSFTKGWNQPFKEFVGNMQYAHREIEKLKQLIVERRTTIFKDELQEVALHPSRIEKWIQMGFLPEDLDKIM
jgi:hypothetical protein